MHSVGMLVDCMPGTGLPVTMQIKNSFVEFLLQTDDAKLTSHKRSFSAPPTYFHNVGAEEGEGGEEEEEEQAEEGTEGDTQKARRPRRRSGRD